MANREALAVIRGARAGHLHAQLELGKLYLHGSGGLPRSLPTALHWLERAATQRSLDACLLIASHVPHALALEQGTRLLPWFEAAARHDPDRYASVYARLARDLGLAPRAAALASPAGNLQRAPAAHAVSVAAESAPSGDVRMAEAERLWRGGDRDAFLDYALPLAQSLSWQAGSAHAGALDHEAARLLARCAGVLAGREDADEAETLRLYETAAGAGDRDAQLALGLLLARMLPDGTRSPGRGTASFKKAVRWLQLAGEQGLAEAWFALARIYIKPEFSQRNIAEAHTYLERAAEMGHREAQLECGLSAWRARREREDNDVRAVYWLMKSSAQGCPTATEWLHRIAPAAPENMVVPAAPDGMPPLLAARLELASVFGLARAEALLIDVRSADCGHCLLVDIRARFGRSKRRIIPVLTDRQREVLDRVGNLFEEVDCGPHGPEGNYRQRLYRLRTLASPRMAA